MSDKYKVMSIDQAIAAGVEEAEDYNSEWFDPMNQMLIDTVSNSVLYVDNYDAPEDKFLFRDLRVFVDELNKQAALIDALWEDIEFLRENGNL